MPGLVVKVFIDWFRCLEAEAGSWREALELAREMAEKHKPLAITIAPKEILDPRG